MKRDHRGHKIRVDSDLTQSDGLGLEKEMASSTITEEKNLREKVEALGV